MASYQVEFTEHGKRFDLQQQQFEADGVTADDVWVQFFVISEGVKTVVRLYHKIDVLAVIRIKE